MTVTEDTGQKALSRERLELKLFEVNGGHPFLQRSMRLDFEISPMGLVWVARNGVKIGRIPDAEWPSFDPETWAATVGDPGEPTVILRPFTIRDCGCVLNLGGWHVRYCDGCGAAAVAENEDAVREPMGWDDLTNDPRPEQERIYREVTS